MIVYYIGNHRDLQASENQIYGEHKLRVENVVTVSNQIFEVVEINFLCLGLNENRICFCKRHKNEENADEIEKQL